MWALTWGSAQFTSITTNNDKLHLHGLETQDWPFHIISANAILSVQSRMLRQNAGYKPWRLSASPGLVVGLHSRAKLIWHVVVCGGKLSVCFSI
jgi:hypothetical protein